MRETQRLAETDCRATADRDDRIRAAGDELLRSRVDDLRRHVRARAVEYVGGKPFEREHHLIEMAATRLRDHEHALGAELAQPPRQ